MRRIGIDVGSTNTDAVLVDGASVLNAVKTPTTEDVTSGVLTALRQLIEGLDGPLGKVDAVMIGTTHFTNAVVQRRDLMKVAAIRIGPQIEPGVPWTASLGEEPLALALKSGNFGGPDFFAKAFEVLR